MCFVSCATLISPSAKWSFILDDGILFTTHSAFIQDSVIGFLASITISLVLERQKLNTV